MGVHKDNQSFISHMTTKSLQINIYFTPANVGSGLNSTHFSPEAFDNELMKTPGFWKIHNVSVFYMHPINRWKTHHRWSSFTGCMSRRFSSMFLCSLDGLCWALPCFHTLFSDLFSLQWALHSLNHSVPPFRSVWLCHALYNHSASLRTVHPLMITSRWTPGPSPQPSLLWHFASVTINYGPCLHSHTKCRENLSTPPLLKASPPQSDSPRLNKLLKHWGGSGWVCSVMRYRTTEVDCRLGSHSIVCSILPQGIWGRFGQAVPLKDILFSSLNPSAEFVLPWCIPIMDFYQSTPWLVHFSTA